MQRRGVFRGGPRRAHPASLGGARPRPPTRRRPAHRGGRQRERARNTSAALASARSDRAGLPWEMHKVAQSVVHVVVLWTDGTRETARWRPHAARVCRRERQYGGTRSVARLVRARKGSDGGLWRSFASSALGSGTLQAVRILCHAGAKVNARFGVGLQHSALSIAVRRAPLGTAAAAGL